MSYYYNYYIGYKKDGKIYPWGPYTADGKMTSVFSKSRSFASDLYESFHPIKEEEISDELRKEFKYTDWNNEPIFDVKYLSVSELPKDDYIEKGYFLIEEVEAYELSNENNIWFEGFSRKLSPQIYAAKLEHQLKFGKNEPQKDEFDEIIIEPNASDYMWYAYPNYDSKAYECSLLRDAINSLENYKIEEYVILETEG